MFALRLFSPTAIQNRTFSNPPSCCRLGQIIRCLKAAIEIDRAYGPKLRRLLNDRIQPHSLTKVSISESQVGVVQYQVPASFKLFLLPCRRSSNPAEK
tara:strand:- start:856 stop:1149 length:294 start_codon:yes stop_codon:yes gene_type:complete